MTKDHIRSVRKVGELKDFQPAVMFEPFIKNIRLFFAIAENNVFWLHKLSTFAPTLTALEHLERCGTCASTIKACARRKGQEIVEQRPDTTKLAERIGENYAKHLEDLHARSGWDRIVWIAHHVKTCEPCRIMLTRHLSEKEEGRGEDGRTV